MKEEYTLDIYSIKKMIVSDSSTNDSINLVITITCMQKVEAFALEFPKLKLKFKDLPLSLSGGRTPVK